MKSTAGKLLVANPNLRGSMFERTIIYVIDHKPQGASGFIVNLSTGISLDTVGRHTGIEWPTPRELYRGGPVESSALYVLHSAEWYGSVNQQAVGNDLCVSSDEIAFERLAMGDTPAYYKVLSGVCGWAPGQLDDEIEGTASYSKGAGWLVMDYADRWVFNAEEQNRTWSLALEAATSQAVQSFF